MNVLVVDDHPLIREALHTVLKALDPGIEVLEAQSVADALKTLRDVKQVDLVLLDLALAEGDGLEVLGEVRARYPAIPVVVLSASDAPETVMRALDAGAMGFIPKSSRNDVLISALRLVLSGGVYLPAEVLRQRPAGAQAASSTSRPVTYHDLGLTERQAQVLALLVRGQPNKLICRALNVAEGTVKIHITAILKALKVANRTQAVIEVGRLGLKLDDVATAMPQSKTKAQ